MPAQYISVYSIYIKGAGSVPKHYRNTHVPSRPISPGQFQFSNYLGKSLIVCYLDQQMHNVYILSIFYIS